jgi:uncharacterized peroxidase-related enzyme
MPHIDLPQGVPGILGPMIFRPETAKPLNELAEVLLRGPSTLSRGERELIAAYVSRLNECAFCERSHSAFAALQLDDGIALVEQVKRDPESARVSARLRALLAIARKVQQGGRTVRDEDVIAARDLGASDVEIHDTVLIAAAFCMFNRYVDGLATWAPADPDAYVESAIRVVEHGYAQSVVSADMA